MADGIEKSREENGGDVWMWGWKWGQIIMKDPVKYPGKTILRISLLILSKMEPLVGFEPRMF